MHGTMIRPEPGDQGLDVEFWDLQHIGCPQLT